jgi:hypothetical protein
MLNLQCSFDKAELQKIYKNLSKVDRVVKGLARTLPRDASRQYSELVRNAIINGRGIRAYAKYSPHYKAWKDAKGFGGKFWKLQGDLERATGSYKIKDTGTVCEYLGGIKAGIKDSGNKNWGLKGPTKDIAWYGRIMEFGRKGQPARPLFGPMALKYYRTSYGRLCNKQFGIIKSLWR